MPDGTCPSCGRPWRPWAGSHLTVCARCRFTPAEQDAILARKEADPRLTLAALAGELRVSVPVVRAVLAYAQARCARARRAA